MMRKFPPGRIVLAVLFLGAAIGIVWLNFSWLVVNPPYTFDTQRDAGTVHFTVSRTHMRPGDCLTFTWQVDQVHAVYFNGAGGVGTDQRVVCATSDAQQLPAMTLKVNFQDEI